MGEMHLAGMYRLHENLPFLAGFWFLSHQTSCYCLIKKKDLVRNLALIIVANITNMTAADKQAVQSVCSLTVSVAIRIYAY